MTEGHHKCTWCGNAVDVNDGFRMAEHPGDRGAVFCRLEHIVPWAIQGADWEAEDPPQLYAALERPATCARCDTSLPETHVLLVRHRGNHRIPDAFCSVDHLADWAKAGGRWQSKP